MGDREGAHPRAAEGRKTTLLGRLGSFLRRANERHVRRYGSYAATLHHHPPGGGGDAGLGGIRRRGLRGRRRRRLLRVERRHTGRDTEPEPNRRVEA